MTELEKIFRKYSPNTDYGENMMNYNGFKSALTEVLKLVEVTDDQFDDSDTKEFRSGAIWMRELMSSRIKRHLK